MTKSKSSFTFFQEYCEKHNLSHEEIQEHFAILQYHVEVEQDTVQDHPPLSAIFAKLRKARQNKSFQTPRQVPDLGLSHAMPVSTDVLVAFAQTEQEQAVFECLQAYFQSDRSSYELLKLSNRLFKLGQAYNKSGK